MLFQLQFLLRLFLQKGGALVAYGFNDTGAQLGCRYCHGWVHGVDGVVGSACAGEGQSRVLPRGIADNTIQPRGGVDEDGRHLLALGAEVLADHNTVRQQQWW